MENKGVLDEVEIRSISWETKSMEYRYTVGQTIRTITSESNEKKSYVICDILRDETSYHKFGKLVYRIYIDMNGSPKLWRAVEDKPVDVIFAI